MLRTVLLPTPEPEEGGMPGGTQRLSCLLVWVLDYCFALFTAWHHLPPLKEGNKSQKVEVDSFLSQQSLLFFLIFFK